MDSTKLRGNIGGGISETDDVSGGKPGAGSGLFLASKSTATMNNCKVAFNTAAYYGTGGGISVTDGSLLMVSESVVNDNVAGVGAGVYIDSSGSATLERCLVENNQAVANSISPGSGGGLAISEGGGTGVAVASQFANNTEVTFVNNFVETLPSDVALQGSPSSFAVRSDCSANSFNDGDGVTLSCDGCSTVYPADLLTTACSSCAQDFYACPGATQCASLAYLSCAPTTAPTKSFAPTPSDEVYPSLDF